MEYILLPPFLQPKISHFLSGKENRKREPEKGEQNEKWEIFLFFPREVGGGYGIYSIAPPLLQPKIKIIKKLAELLDELGYDNCR